MTVDASYRDTPTATSRKVFLITPHATNPIVPIPYKGLLIGDTGGDIVMSSLDDPTTFVTIQVAANSYVPVVPHIIRVTGTEATTIHGLT